MLRPSLIIIHIHCSQFLLSKHANLTYNLDANMLMLLFQYHVQSADLGRVCHVRLFSPHLCRPTVFLKGPLGMRHFQCCQF